MIPLIFGLPRAGHQGHRNLEISAGTKIDIPHPGQDRDAQILAVAIFVPGLA